MDEQEGDILPFCEIDSEDVSNKMIDWFFLLFLFFYKNKRNN